jgi:serine/threonine-protein kinase
VSDVWRAKDLRFECRLVAVKFLREDTSDDVNRLRRLFRTEANAAASLRHENIVSVFDYGEEDGAAYLVMEYVEGRTLDRIIAGSAPVAMIRRLRWIEELCAGLGYAHRRTLVHREIKPSNLIIDNEGDRLRILDFGVAWSVGGADVEEFPIGTLSYMSPEQTKASATLDHRSDIFAVGVVFYELLS